MKSIAFSAPEHFQLQGVAGPAGTQDSRGRPDRHRSRHAPAHRDPAGADPARGEAAKFGGVKCKLEPRAARIMARIQEMRGGKDYDSNFATRMMGEGLWAELIRQRFEKTCHQLSFNRQRTGLNLSQFRPPGEMRQGSLFFNAAWLVAQPLTGLVPGNCSVASNASLLAALIAGITGILVSADPVLAARWQAARRWQ